MQYERPVTKRQQHIRKCSSLTKTELQDQDSKRSKYDFVDPIKFCRSHLQAKADMYFLKYYMQYGAQCLLPT